MFTWVLLAHFRSPCGGRRALCLSCGRPVSPIRRWPAVNSSVLPFGQVTPPCYGHRRRWSHEYSVTQRWSTGRTEEKGLLLPEGRASATLSLQATPLLLRPFLGHMGSIVVWRYGSHRAHTDHAPGPGLLPRTMWSQKHRLDTAQEVHTAQAALSSR